MAVIGGARSEARDADRGPGDRPPPHPGSRPGAAGGALTAESLALLLRLEGVLQHVASWEAEDQSVHPPRDELGLAWPLADAVALVAVQDLLRGARRARAGAGAVLSGGHPGALLPTAPGARGRGGEAAVDVVASLADAPLPLAVRELFELERTGTGEDPGDLLRAVADLLLAGPSVEGGNSPGSGPLPLQ